MQAKGMHAANAQKQDTAFTHASPLSLHGQTVHVQSQIYHKLIHRYNRNQAARYKQQARHAAQCHNPCASHARPHPSTASNCPTHAYTLSPWQA